MTYVEKDRGLVSVIFVEYSVALFGLLWDFKFYRRVVLEEVSMEICMQSLQVYR